MNHNKLSGRPKVAAVDANILSIMGLRRILHNVMPAMEVVPFASIDQLRAAGIDNFVHFFVEINQYIHGRQLFEERKKTTIVLIASEEQRNLLDGVNVLCVNVSEQNFIHDLLSLLQRGHGNPLPETAQKERKTLTPRELEVLVRVVKGNINKEIADQMHISVTTVITHRKNITEKLGIKSVPGLTIYAVMNGYVDLDLL